ELNCLVYEPLAMSALLDKPATQATNKTVEFDSSWCASFA
ncbi:MAG: hypothetical protein ACI9G1_003578, partial [Pirellulaceae bacterium]